MYFDTFQAALYMDGHGTYVWAAYLITLLVIVFILLAPARRRARFVGRMQGELRRAAGAPSAKGESNASGT